MQLRRIDKFLLLVLVIIGTYLVLKCVYGQLADTAQLNRINVTTDIVSAIASVVTLVLAFLVYGKFGIEQRLLNHQFDTVANLAKEIAKLKFIIKSVDTEKGVHKQIIFFNPRSARAFLDNQDQGAILVADSYMNAIREIESCGSDLLMPHKIAQTINSGLLVGYIDQTEGMSLSEYQGKKYWVIEDNRPNSQEKYFLIGKPNGEDMNLKDFAKRWELLLVAIEKWLKENGSLPINLNR